MCDSPPGENDDNSIVSGGSTIYSTPVAQLGSTNDLANAATSPPPLQNQQSTNLKSSSSTNNKVNNVQESSRNVSEPKTGNQNAMTPKQEMQNSTDAYSSPQSQRRACSSGQVRIENSKVNVFTNFFLSLFNIMAGLESIIWK